MSNQVQETGTYKNISSSALIYTGNGHLLGIWVSSASATPTIKVEDAVTDTTPLIANTFTPSAATYYPIPANFGTGLYVAISGTVDCTVIYKPSLS